MRKTWTDAFEDRAQESMPPGANNIRCLSVLKVGEDGDELRIKSRNLLLVSRHRARLAVRRDSSAANVSVVRIFLSLEVVLGFSFGTADVNGEYMLSGLIRSELFECPRNSTRQAMRSRKGKVKTLHGAFYN